MTQTQHAASYFHTPDELAKSAFLHVLRAGHLYAAPDYVVDRNVCTGHDLIYCVKGIGHVRVRGTEHTIRPSQLLWIDGRHPHRHWPEASDPWEVLWVRADGCALTLSAEALGVRQKPVFMVSTGAAGLFRNVLQHLKTQPAAINALLHADTSAILAEVFSSRWEAGNDLEGMAAGPALRLVIANMGTYLHRRWTVRQLAEKAHMTEQQFFRAFHLAQGCSPIAYLRRQRINHAKRKLVETSDSVKEIAEQVGYSNPFYFSRDFRNACGLSPKHYREQEKLLQSAAN